MTDASRRRVRVASLLLLALAFVVAGSLHFVRPTTYARLVPPRFPAPRTLVAVSGVAEVVGGIGLLVPSLRRAAGFGLIALLVCVFPANLHMAVKPEGFADLGVPTWALWARLPLQGVLIAWVWWIAVRRPPSPNPMGGVNFASPKSSQSPVPPA